MSSCIYSLFSHEIRSDCWKIYLNDVTRIMEGQVVQSIQTKLAALIGLAAIAFTSIAVLLDISIARDFLPGIVELTVALSVALIFGIVTLVPRGVSTCGATTPEQRPRR